jgi:putative endonuclease
MTPYYVYILRCEGNTFYTGYTKSVKTRLRLHLSGKGARYTKMHRPKSLVYTEKFSSRSEAMRREKRIKKLNHSQKMRLTRAYRKRQYRSGKKQKPYDSAQM